MVKGLDIFREHFSDFQDSYIMIGGTACELAMDEIGDDFGRTTKDLDIVLNDNSKMLDFLSSVQPTCFIS
jgi:hypothetical protein